ncbi:MAG: exodeoxyribonuclease III [Patescibacteria group bacterium]
MKNLKIYSWNVNGIRAVYKKVFLNWFKRTKPDILCLQEVRARKDQMPKDLLEVKGYYSYFEHARVKKGYSGVAIYSKIKPNSISTKIGVKKFDQEGRIQITEFDDFILCNIYFPNGGRDKKRVQYKLDFYEAFLKYIDKLRKQGKKIIVCGDVNTAHNEIDLFHPKENENNTGFLPVERAWLDKLIKHGYVDVFRKFNNKPHQYTWWDQKTRARERNVGWRIDYFFVSKNLANKVTEAKIHPRVMGSDHCPISIELDI